MEFASSYLVPALRSLARNKMRTGLTMLGIVIGVSAVITTVALGNGAGGQMQGTVAALGSNMLMVFPGSMNRNGLQVGIGQTKTLVSADEASIVNDVPNVTGAAGGVQTSTQIVWENNNWFTQAIGTEPSYFQVRSWTFAAGGPFDSSDLEREANVAVIGETVRRKLFGVVNPLGQVIRIKNLPFRIIGVLAAKGSSGFGQDQDDVILVPLTTEQRKIVGITWLNWVFVNASSPETSDVVKTDITKLMRDRHKIQPASEDDFQVQSMAEFANTLKQITSILTLLLGAVASVALLVGGIGIMNIMLVSVTERTREIGIRIAIGATEGDVQLQFLIEAVMLSLIGGVAGITVGELASWIVDLALSWTFTVSIPAVTLAVLFSAAIGIAFGYYPARRASRLNPIEALRYE
ncbi:MAG TPA: ABC transporter permease [Terracidiphilus sp.]|nr:ABC transporter permease [Terracidiphilus sp.]